MVENDTCIHATSNMKDIFFKKLECCFWFKKTTDYFTGNLVGNMIEHVSEMEMYIILSTLETNAGEIRVLITKYYGY